MSTSTNSAQPRTRPAVLILGANGRFGSAAGMAFAAAGWQVLAQARRVPDALPPGAVHVGLPLSDIDGLARAAASARTVVHAVNPLYDDWSGVLPLARQGMAIAERLGATFMLPGNVYNFGTGMPARLDENTPERPNTEKGRIRSELELEMAGRATTGLKSVVIRAGDFFGAGTGSWLDQAIAKGLAQGKLVYPGPTDRVHAWAYLPDLARAFVATAAAADRLPAFTRLHFEGHNLTGAALLAALERAAGSLGLAPPRGWRSGGMPWPLIRAVGLVRPLWRELAAMSYLWSVPHALDGSAMRHLIGKLPHTPIDFALRASLRELGFGQAEDGSALPAASA